MTRWWQRTSAVLGVLAVVACALGLLPTSIHASVIRASAVTPTSLASAQPVSGPAVIRMANPPPPREAAPAPTRLIFSERIVRRFDFEERAMNPEEVPLNWFRAQHLLPDRPRPGFPAFNRPVFDETLAASGATSVMLPTRGGSTSLRLGAGVILVFPDAQYRVTAMVRTGGLVNARGVLRATMLDELKRPIEGSEVSSEPVLSENAWQSINVDLPGGIASARFLQLELLLLQPAQLALLDPTARAGPRGPDDIQGAVWFDDVSVLQLPRVSILTGVPGNVFVTPERPSVTLDVRDLSGQELTAELEITDIDDAPVASRSVLIPRGGSRVNAALELPRFGWYRVRMRLVGLSDVPGAAQTLASTTLMYLDSPTDQVPDQDQDLQPAPPPPQAHAQDQGQPAQTSDARRGTASPLRPFAIVATGLPPELLGDIPAVAQAVGVPRLTLGVSGGDVTQRGALSAKLDALLSALAQNPADLTIAIERLPADLAARARLDPRAVLALGAIDRAEWEGELAGWIGELGQRVSAWQIGGVVTDSPLNHASVAGQLDGFRRGLARVSPSPRPSLPWKADSAWPDFAGSPGPAAAAITLPASFPVASIADALLVAAPAAQRGVDVTYVIEPLDRSVYSRRDVLDDWLQRAVEVWAHTHRSDERLPPARVALWPGLRPAPNRSLRPDPLLGAMATLAKATEGMHVVGPFESVPGVRGYVLAPTSGTAIGSLNIGSGALIVWSTGEAGPIAEIAGYFGGGRLTVRDAMGNRTDLPPPARGGEQRFTVGTTPVFVQGLDPHLVQFLADIRINPGFVPAVVASHDCELLLTNPWSTRISGEVTLVSPDAANIRAGTRREATWSVTPTAPIGFSIPAGGRVRLPFNFVFAAAEEAGVKNLGLSIKLAADRPYAPMSLSRPINVGLEDLDLTVSAQNAPRTSGPDVVVTATVANTGQLIRTLQLSAMANGFATQSQPVVDLGPGESAVRRFVFRNAAATLSGRRVRMMLADIDGAERMTKFAAVP
jgi:hypothetical protein